MVGQLKVRKGFCSINVANEYAFVEQDGVGFVVDHIRPICNVWKEYKEKVSFRVYQFEEVPSNGTAEVFTFQKGKWTVQLYRWTETQSFVVELWKDADCVSSLEWNDSSKGLGVYVYGEPSSFISFVEETISNENQTKGGSEA
jgi:hypothetical protein